MQRTRSHVARQRLCFALLLTLAALPACGRKTPPRAPELVRPETIDNLEAKQSETGVVLTWRRPLDYVDRTRMPDLGSFIVERADADGAFHPIQTLEVTDRERFRKNRHLKYTDTTAKLGERYRYRVLSATLDDYVSEPSNVAEIATVSP